MTIPSESPPAHAALGVRFFRAAARWVVEHTGRVTLLTVLLVAAGCVSEWWMAYRHAQDWDASHPGQPVPFRLFATVGWILILGSGGWLGLWSLSSGESKAPSTSSNADWWRFDFRERQRVFERRPIGRSFLWIHGLFGLLGFALGVAVVLRLAAAAGWQDPLLSRRNGPFGLLVLAILVTAFAARRIRDVLFLQDCDRFVGERAQELAQAFAEEEQAEVDAEREYERKTIAGWPYIILMGGLVGGLFLAYRWLPEADGTTASQGCMSGLIGSVAAVYLLKSKPRGWQIWLVVAFACAVGLLVFTHETWHRSPLYLLLGTLWGVGVGVAATLLHLRKLRRK